MHEKRSYAFIKWVGASNSTDQFEGAHEGEVSGERKGQVVDRVLIGQWEYTWGKVCVNRKSNPQPLPKHSPNSKARSETSRNNTCRVESVELQKHEAM